jgi:PKD repeat protein
MKPSLEQKTIVTALLCSFLILFALPLIVTSPGYACTDPGTCSSFSIGSYSLVSQKKVTSTIYQYTYQASLTNSSSAIGKNITATATSKVFGVTLSDSSLFFGEIAAGSTIQSTNTFTIRAKAGYVVKGPDLSWYVNGVTVPIADAGPNQTVTLPSGKTSMVVQLNGSGSVDICGNVTKYVWTGTPNPSDVMKPSVTLSPGTYVFSLIVMDNGYTWSSPSTVTITVLSSSNNKAPTVSAGSPQTITLPASATLTGTATDDGLPSATLTTTWSKVSGSGTVTFGSVNALSTTASFSVAGTYVLRLTASDGALSSSATVTITVLSGPVNKAPTVSAGSPQTITLPASATLTGTATDDGLPSGTLTTTWNKVSGSGTVTFGSVNALSTTASFSVAGTYVLRLTASDGTLTSTSDVAITVGAANQVPIANAGTSQNVTIAAGQTTIVVQLDGSASTDPDGTIASYAWTGTPTPEAIAKPSVTLAAGTHTFSLIVTDDKGAPSASSSVTITVNSPANQAPIANAGSNQTIKIPYGKTSVKVTLDGSASTDPDGTIASYVWTGTPTPGATAKPTVILTEGTFTFTLKVTDDKGLASTNSSPVSVAVAKEDIHQPTLTVVPAACQVLAGDAAGTNISVSAASPDGRLVTITAAPQVANATFTTSPGLTANGTFSFKPNFTQAGVYLVTFTARDSYGITMSGTAQITVTADNRPPVLTLQGTATVAVGSTLKIPVVASDPDGNTLTLSASGLPSNAIFAPSAGAITFAPVTGQVTAAGSPLVWSVTANDGISSVTKEIRVTVTAGSGQEGPLTLTVDPVESPTFLSTQRITGTVNGSGPGQPAQTSGLITSMSPTGGKQGETLTVVLAGNGSSYPTHFIKGTSAASFGSGVTISSLSVTDPTHATAIIIIDKGASVGARSVTVTTGSETAVSLNAFNVLKGQTTVTGRLIDPTSGQPIVNATIVIQGTNISAKTDGNGYYSFTDIPAGQQTLVVAAPNREVLTITVNAEVNSTVTVDDLKPAATVFDPSAAPLVSVVSVVGRGITGLSPRTDKAGLKMLLTDAILLVGGDSLGIFDEYGNQLSPEVTGDGMTSIKPEGLNRLADSMLRGETFTLAELLQGFSFGYVWGGSENPLSLQEWMGTLQTMVTDAWSDPQNPDSYLPLVIFNSGPSLLADPPALSPMTRINHFQAFLFTNSLLTYMKTR